MFYLFVFLKVLSMVVHKRKMMSRLEKIQSAKKQCYSLNQLISSKKVFNTYVYINIIVSNITNITRYTSRLIYVFF